MDVKNSAALDRIISYAQTLTGKKGGSISLDMYIVAVIDAATGKLDLEPDDPCVIDLRSLLSEMFPMADADFSDIRSLFMERVMKKKNVLNMDSLSFQQGLMNARSKASSGNIPELTPHYLLMFFYKKPVGYLSEFLNRDINKPDPADEWDVMEEDTGEDDSELCFVKTTSEQNGDMSADKEPETETADQKEPKKKISAIRSPKEYLAALTEDMKEKYRRLTEEVLGQEHAVSEFISGLFRAEIKAKTTAERKGARASFLFAGPPGVGKTKLAETVAKMLDIPYERFDMSEYSDHEAATEFIGSDAVFKGSASGNFTEFVAKNPHCVILLDEIEKAHITIIHLLLQILDKGRIRDKHTDRELPLHNVILIITTNAGKQLYENSEVKNLSGLSKKVILNALEKDVNPQTNQPFFPSAIVSRFSSGNVVMFNYLDAKVLRQIARKCILDNISGFEKEFGIKLEIDEDVYTALLFAESGSVDGRNIYARAEAFFHSELFELFRLITSPESNKIENIDKVTVSIDLSAESKEIQSYFRDASEKNALVFASEETAEKCNCSKDTKIFGVQDLETAKQTLREQDIHYALIDIRCGARGASDYLNIEDVDSVSRDLLHYLKESRPDLPVYLLVSEDHPISDEELVSFLSLGVSDTVTLTEDKDKLIAQLDSIAVDIHQQNSIDKLTRANKLLTFETAQTIDTDSRIAEVKLFDFKTTTAVDAEDSRSILSNLSKPNTTFDQIIGAEDAKSELKYFVDYLKNPKKFIDTGVSAPKGVLLYGPPGTGKTMLAKATANASDVTFINIAGNELVTSYSGESKQKVIDTFKIARKYAPSIIFIDEIDTIARNRTGGSNFVANEEALTALLAEMDGFKNNTAKPVFVLAATNYDVNATGEKSLDPAVLRRFDRRIYVDLPNRDERKRYLQKRFAENKIFEISEEKLNNISIRSTGMSLADLSSVVELALRSAIKDGNLKVTEKIFDEAFETFHSGEKTEWDDSLLLRVARHESGHAFLYWYGGEKPSYVTIVARSNFGGYMMKDDNESKHLLTRDEMIGHIRTSLAGRAAEVVYYGEKDGVSTGASGDFSSATNTALSMICYYGMSEKFGYAVMDPRTAKQSPMAAEIYEEINRILNEEMQNTVRILSENREAIDALVDELMLKNHLSGDEIQAIFDQHAKR